MGLGGGGGWGSTPAGGRFYAQTDAPPGITINSATVTGASITNINNGQGWGGGSYYAGGGNQWFNGQTSEYDGTFNSSYWGFQIVCGWASCGNVASIFAGGIQLTGTENQGPSLTAIGADNVWYQSGRWIWNAPAIRGSMTLAASDPSGICRMSAIVNGHYMPGPAFIPNTSRVDAVPKLDMGAHSKAPALDTRDYVTGAGQMPLTLAASNAAGIQSQVSETLNVDNDPVGVSLTASDDPNPTVWVNHAVTVQASATAGPSGVGGMSCSADGGTASPYSPQGVTVNGDGTHVVSCRAWNNAVNPHGSANTGTSSLALHLDEAPPSVAIEAQDPADPARVIVDTNDRESGVQGGTIDIAPAGSGNWTPVPTGFDGQHLLADINDAGLRGAYTVRATSCDNVGNCTSTDESLNLPLRLAARSAVSFAEIEAPAVTVRRRVLVGWHYGVARRNHKLVIVHAGGHYITVKVVIRKNAACSDERVRTGPHRWHEITACRPVKVKTLGIERVAHGKPTTVHGLLISAEGVPIANAPVEVRAAPDNGLHRFARLSTVRTDGKGGWSAPIPPGPSQLIEAVYGGSATTLPATGTVHTVVPASVRLISASPRHVPWGGTVRIVGQLEGGYIPAGGALVRLRIGIGSAFTTYGVKEHVTGSGRFTTSYTFGLGVPSVKRAYWFQVASLPMGNYPWAPADSRRVTVIVGGTP